MDSPINRMIDRSSNRKAASSMKAKAKRTKALNDQVLSLVAEANATALPERHVTPRAALIVMARAMKELSSLPEESREYGVLREVTKFISLNQKTLLASASTKHADLLPKGHPLSPLNASLTEEELRKKYSEWIAADPSIADEARPLVAMAHSLAPDSIEREHAFLRLRTLQASAVPAYFKIDEVTALIAAFSSGNSSAARRARVALQWRDRLGRWIEMGRGINFRFRMPDGSIATGKGTYVGAGSNPRVERSSSGTSLVSDTGLIEVSGVPGLAPGLYAIGSNNAAAYQARIPGFEAPQAPSFKDQFDADVPSIADLQAARRDLPIGWKKQGPYYVSDDNYAVIPGPNGQPQAVTRLNQDGRPAGTVGNARDWSEVNALIEKDQPSFDKEIARIEGEGEEGQLPLARIPGATEDDVVSFDDIVNMQKQRAEENKKFDAATPAPKPLGDKDLNGNVVPNSWVRDATDDKAYTRDMPLRDGGTYPLSARVTEDGKYVAGHAAGWIPEPGTDGRGAQRKFESWKEIESAIPEFVEYLNEGFTKNNPIALGESAPEGKPVGTPASELRPGDKVKHKGEWKTIKSIDKLNLGSRLNFEDGTSDDIGIKSVPAIRKPDATGGALVDNRDGTFRYKGVTLKKVFGKWTSGKALDPRIGKHDTIEDAMAKIDSLESSKTEKPSAPSAPATERPRFGEGYGEDTRTGKKTPLTSGKKNYAVSFEALRDEETLTEAGLDPDGEYEDSEILNAWLKAKGLDGRVKVKSLKEGYGGPESVLEIPEEAKADFVKAYGNFAPGTTFQDLVDDGMLEEVVPSAATSGDLTKIDKSTLDALNKRMREDSTGEYNMEGVTFAPDNNGNIVMYPDAWEPGDKIIGRIEDDGGIDWESDEQYDKYAEKVTEALRGMGEGSPAEGADNLKKVDDALAFLDEHMDASGTTESGAMAISDIQDKVKAGKKALEAGNTESALGYFDDAYTDLDNGYGEEGSFESSDAGAEALDLLDKLITSLESGESSGTGNSISKEAFNGLKNKIAEENKGGYSKSGLYFFHDLIGPDDGALSKDITFMIDEDEEFSPLGTISSDGTITWNDPSKQEDWAPALESALKSFTEGKDKFTKNKNTGYMEYDLGDGYVVSYGKDEDGNWSAEMNRFSRDGGLDSENSFPAKSEADARAMAEGLIDRYNDSQEREGGPGDGPGSGGGDFTNRFAELKKLASGEYSMNKLFDTMFNGAKFESPSDRPMYTRDYSMPDDVEIYYFEQDSVLAKKADGEWAVYFPDGESLEGDDIEFQEYLDSILANDGDSPLAFYQGALIDSDLQSALEEARSKEPVEGDGPGEPPSGPTTPSGDYGSDFTEMVVDGAGSKSFMDRELEEMLDDNATNVGTNFADLMWDAADDRFDLQDQFDANRPVDLNKNDFIEAAVEAFNEDIDANLESAIDERLGSDIDYDRNSFDAKSFKAAAERRYRELLEGLFEYDGDEGPDEPPSPGGGTPPKVPSPSTPGSPALFGDFDKPAGAFQLRTTEYEPEGRIDEASTDFTDDPRRLATKFTLDDLVTALTEALIGRPSDEAMQDILDANVGDDDDLPGLDDLDGVASSPAPRAGEVSGPGAGALEFNAGEEYVQAEALYNAVYEAGGDPNRVIANAYDAVNGNRNNARKLLEAQGGVPSQEESQLIDDMTDEIRQIKDATPDDEISVSQKRSKPDEKFKGELIENVPVDFNNPDYFDMDTDAYIPSAPEIDENGYTDNPEILAVDYFTADLLEQMLEGITDGSGIALLDFGGDQGPGEVPVEALRDALQMQGVNTNDVLFKLRDESNDMSEEEKPNLSREDIRWDAQKGLYTDVNGKVLDGDTVDAAGLDSSLRDAPDPDIKVLPSTAEQEQAPETPAAVAPQGSVEFAPFSDALADLDEEDPSTPPNVVLSLDDAANSLVDLFSNGMQPDVKFLSYNSLNGIILIRPNDTDLQQAQTLSMHPNGSALRLDGDPDWFLSDAGRAYGWKEIPSEVEQAIRQENARRYPEFSVADRVPTAETAAPAPAFMYPGPREAGYSANNTTLASDGSVIGAGSIVTANRDGKRGTVVSIQNDPEYARIKFDDGKIAVRSANQIKAVSNPDGSLATAPSGALAPSAPSPATDVRERLEAPLRDAPNIARPGSAWGINDASTVPNRIAPFTQKDVPQSKFKAWRSRDAEIAKAANTRASFDSLFKAAQAALIAKEDRSLDYPALMEEFEALLKDAYGTRDDLTFGADRYKVSVNSVTLSYGNGDIRDGNVSYQMHVRFDVLGENGDEVGGGSRYIRSDVTKNADGTTSHKTYVKNDVLKIFGTNQKKGFATAYNRHMENWYIANGVEKVKVLAYGGGSEWKGGFVWALNGFNWESGSSALSVARAIERAANTPQEKELATRLRERVSMANGDLSQMPLPIEMALIGWYNGADKWLGKEVMTNLSWEGIKHLDPGAKEQMYSANYDQIKSAERRVRAGQNKANVSSVGLVQIMDNQFQDSNPELLSHMEQIRDALRNNRPLGFLSPAAKASLNTYVSDQLRDKNSLMPMDDLFRLRNALDAEYRADYDFADPFAGVGNALVDFSLDDYLNNSDALKAAGFEALALSEGQNNIFRVTHKASGQVFFVKEEHLSQDWDGERGLTREVEANTLLNALGMHGISDVRASRANEDVFIMSQSGATLPLTSEPVNAESMFYVGITNPVDGTNVRAANGTFVDALSNPEDILSMAIIDMLGDSEDRHDANWMVAFDSTTNRLRMFPIDHGLIRIETDSDVITPFLTQHWPSAGEVYQAAMPRLIDLAGEARTKEMFLNQVDKLITNIDNPLFQPKGEELAALIEKWGSYDAFKDAMKERLTRIVTPGTDENTALGKSMKRNYWR